MNQLIKINSMIKGAGSGKGGDRDPESPDSLFSQQKVKIIDLVSEGEIVGLPAVDPLKNVYVDGTPVQNADGTFNYLGLKLSERTGTQSQEHISGIPGVEQTIGVGIDVKLASPHTVTISDATIDDLRVTINIPGLLKTNPDTGDIRGSSVSFLIEKEVDGGGFTTEISETITGKSSGGFSRDFLIKLDAGTVRQVRFTRITPDASSALLQNKTVWQSYTTIINEKFTYPNSALYGIEMDSAQFNSIPVRGYKVKGVKIQIPTNYDPLTRAYSPPIWDGTFKTEWTDNPAWIFYDLATNTRYGLGQFLPAALMNKFDLFAIGQYCDTLVDDGFGGTEPRFTCNTQIQNKQEAYKLLLQIASSFLGMPYWAGGQLTAVQDSPSTPVAMFNEANVQDGDFNYSGSAAPARHTVALVTWNNPDNLYKPEVEYVENSLGVERYGVRTKDMVAVGATSRGQAHRVGLWALYSEVNETEIVKFTTGVEATVLYPGALIEVQDPNRTAKDFGGRVSLGYTGLTIIDEKFDPDPGWTMAGIGTPPTVVDGRVVSPLAAGASYFFKGIGAENEVSLEAEFEFSSDFSIPVDTEFLVLPSINPAAGNLLSFIVTNVSGTLRFQIIHYDDVGGTTVTVSNVDVELQKKYNIRLHYRQATTALSNDGVYRAWLDNVNILDVTNSDNNSKVASTILTAGFVFPNVAGTATGTVYTDNIKVKDHRVDTSDNKDLEPVDYSIVGNVTQGQDKSEFISTQLGGGINKAGWLFPPSSEVWAEVTIQTDEGGVLSTNGHTCDFLTLGTGGKTAGIILKNNSGILQFTTQYQTDAGVVNADVTSPVFVWGKTYKLKMRHKVATSAVSNDGIVQVWINDELVLDVQDADNNPRTIDEFVIGCDSGNNSSANFVVRMWNAKLAETGAGVSLTTIPLDVPVTLETARTYTLATVLSDGTIEKRSVTNAIPGTHSVITLATPLTTVPQEQSVWVLESDIESAATYRILSVTESEKLNREVLAVEHDPDKFAIIESGVLLTVNPLDITRGTIPAPSNLLADEYLTSVNGEVISVLSINWDDINKAVGYNIRWRLENENWQSNSSPVSYFEISGAITGVYTVQVSSISANGLVSNPTTITTQVQGIDKLELAPRVSGLELFSQGNETDFVGRDAKFTWRKAANINSFNLGSEPAGADSGSTDTFFKDFEVRMYDTNDINTRSLLRVEHVTDNFYTYTWEKNVEDARFRAAPNTSIPYRGFVIEVYQRNINNAISASPAKLAVQNPPPILPTEIFHTKSVYQHFIRYTPPLDHDWVGMIVWRSVSPGFTPGQANKIYKGQDTFIVMDGTPGTTYYYRYAAYDAFDETGLVVSGENTIILNQIVQLDIDPVVTFPIPDLSITNAKLANLTILAGKLAANSITETKITNGAITTLKIAADSVTANEIAVGTITALEITTGTITASEIAALTITAGEIAANTITAGQIAANTITAGEIAANTITASEIQALAITANEIAANTITGGEIAANTITGSHIFGATITADKYFELRNSHIIHASDSLDATYPFEVEFPLSSELLSPAGIKGINLSFKIKNFRSYSSGAAAGGQQTSSAGGAQTSSAGGAQTTTETAVGTHVHTWNILSGGGWSTNLALRYDVANKRFTRIAGAANVGVTTADGHFHYVPVSSGTGALVYRATSGELAYNTAGGGDGIITTTSANGHVHTVPIPGYSVSGQAVYVSGSTMFASSTLTVTTDPSPSKHTHTVANHTHTVANHTHSVIDHTHTLVHGIFEEVTSPTINVYVDDGAGYGASIGAYTTDQLELDLVTPTKRFNSAGWKAIKFTSTLRARIIVSLELKLDIAA